mgnify:CR=1 FL=1
MSKNGNGTAKRKNEHKKKIDELRKQFVKANATDGKLKTSYLIYLLLLYGKAVEKVKRF